MKIVYVVPDPNRIGGVSRSIQRMMHHLNSNGVEATLFCPDFEAQNGISKPEMMMMRDIFKGTHMQEWTQRVIEKLEAIEPDLVVGYYGSSAAFAATAAAKFLKIPCVACFRGNDINRDFFSPIYADRLRFVAQHASALTTVSSEMKDKVSVWLGADAQFISNSVDTSLFYRRKTEDVEAFKQRYDLDERPVVGLFGEFKPSRGMGILTVLESELKAIQTIIVGEVRNDIKSEMPDWITVIPYIEDVEELATAYSSCDVILQPSRFDGMPNVVLEAMACERTVLGSPTGGIKDLIQHGKNGYLCSTDEDWKNTLRQVLRAGDPNIGIEARKSVPNPNQEASAFLELFTSVLETTQSSQLI